MHRKSIISCQSRNLLLSAVTLIGLTALATELTIRFSSAALSRGTFTNENRANGTPAAKDSGTLEPRVAKAFGKLPLQFEANEGRTDPRVKFLSRGPGYGIF